MDKEKIFILILFAFLMFSLFVLVFRLESVRYRRYCSGDMFNCSNFETIDDAKYMYHFCGGLNRDIHNLDRDKDGIPCNHLK